MITLKFPIATLPDATTNEGNDPTIVWPLVTQHLHDRSVTEMH